MKRLKIPCLLECKMRFPPFNTDGKQKFVSEYKAEWGGRREKAGSCSGLVSIPNTGLESEAQPCPPSHPMPHPAPLPLPICFQALSILLHAIKQLRNLYNNFSFGLIQGPKLPSVWNRHLKPKLFHQEIQITGGWQKVKNWKENRDNLRGNIHYNNL